MSSIKSCVAAAKMQLDIEVSTQDLWLMKRAQDAMRMFNNPEVHVKKEKSFKVDSNGRFKLPDDFYQLIAVQAIPTSVTPPLTANYLNASNGLMVYVDRPFINKCGLNLNGNRNCFGSFQINNDFVQFNGDFRGIDKASMCYLAYPIDDDGLACVPDEYEEAIMYFLCFNYALKKRWPAEIRMQYNGLWNSRFNKVNGDAQMRFYERVRPQIMAAFNSLVADKNISIT